MGTKVKFLCQCIHKYLFRLPFGYKSLNKHVTIKVMYSVETPRTISALSSHLNRSLCVTIQYDVPTAVTLSDAHCPFTITSLRIIIKFSQLELVTNNFRNFAYDQSRLSPVPPPTPEIGTSLGELCVLDF